MASSSVEGKYGHLGTPSLHDDMVLSSTVSPRSVEQVKTLSLDGHTVVVSYPKTGTTWLQEIVWLLENECSVRYANALPSFKRIPYLEHASTGTEPKDRNLTQVVKSHLPVRYFEKQLQEGRTKFVIIVRNPKDTLVSMYHFYQMVKHIAYTGSWDDFFQLYKNKHLIYGDFFDWYEGWLDQPDLQQKNILFVKYEDLKYQADEQIERIAAFLGKTADSETVKTIITHTAFHNMKENKMTNYSGMPFFKQEISPFIRKGIVGDWKQYFSPEQSSDIDKTYNEKLEGRGFHLSFN